MANGKGTDEVVSGILGSIGRDGHFVPERQVEKTNGI